MSRKPPKRAQQSRHVLFAKAIALAVCVTTFLMALSYLWDGGLKADSYATLDSVPEQAIGLATDSPQSGELPAEQGAGNGQADDEIRAPTAEILLVNAANPLPDNFYPETLVSLFERGDQHFQLATSDIKVCEIVSESMDAMFAAAERDGVGGFIITSGYRTQEEQRALYTSTIDGTAAKPGESEHETGLAFDVDTMGNEHFERTPQYAWLSAHCAEYGFIIRYPRGAECLTGFPYEPWHYRFVGKEHATIIMSRGITLEQYCEELR
ncbi:MAG: M15 family metallopeptidase [Coriobacteriales bacterium]|jgi:D-alanyl-D-alanine carboxypeptidase|nr:M15 family metallopeptidase [Coriobacteriales bacterium]